MPRYCILGLVIELPWAVDLPESSQPVDARIAFGPPETIPEVEHPSGLRVIRQGSTLDLCVSRTCRMLVPGPGETVLCFPDGDTDPREVRRQILEHLIPRLLSRRVAAVLHASSVVFQESVLGFTAASGSGKSTLALALARAGAVVLGDDSLLLEPGAQAPMAHPLWATVRIHASDLAEPVRARAEPPIYGKSALQQGDDPELRFSRRAWPLRRLYVLERADDMEIVQLPPRAALLAVLRETYHLAFDDLPGLDQQMARLERLGVIHRTYRLAYPRDFGRLGEVCARILEHAAEP